MRLSWGESFFVAMPPPVCTMNVTADASAATSRTGATRPITSAARALGSIDTETGRSPARPIAARTS